MPFEIVGVLRGQAVRAIQQRPAVAAFTAERWAHSGMRDVRVLWDGRPVEVGDLRRHFGLT